LDPFLGVIEEILHLGETAPKKQRHTAKRIFERLVDEHGYTGSESHVRPPRTTIVTARRSSRSPGRG
jgi:hypothetical protein